MARSPRSKKPKLDALEGVTDPKAPLDSSALLAAARTVLAKLEADLRARAAASPAVTRALEERYAKEKEAHRTAESFVGWSAALATQVAAAWLLSCVFVRTLEDRGLLRQARLAGPGALDSQKLFYEMAPSLNERDYLLTVFRELSTHPAAEDLFDAEHSLVWKLSPSADAVKELLQLFRTPNADVPAFRFGQASTRFLGDLYQDLSEDVRKRYALLQTPDFVESFILDRTLEPAIERFGLDDTTVIDPTCGSGHFLLGSFDRLFEHRLRNEPGVDRRVAATRALDAVFGADINPYAVAIARFRLTLSYLEKAGYKKLAEAPALPLHLVVADSLRINPQHKQSELWEQKGVVGAKRWIGESFALEDEAAARDVLHRQYAAVVGNPPYITEKDAAKREVYREMYVSAAGKYALSAPFCERFFQLGRARGYVGQITANSFMKREFGKKLIEEYLPTVNLELVVNTSGAYIPGHGTPTVLLFGTQESAMEADLLAVLAKRSEPAIPEDPSEGVVWTSIAEHWSEPQYEDEFVSVARVGRSTLDKHPWSLGGGGAAELKELLEQRAPKRLEEIAESIGISCVTGEDEVYLLPAEVARRLDIGRTRPLVTGEFVRDWSLRPAGEVLFPYDEDLAKLPTSGLSKELKYLWPYRSVINKRRRFGVPMLERGLTWYELQELYAEKLRTPLSITIAFVATHNHFALDRGGKVFKQSAPIIKLPAKASEEEHLALLGYLNSSTACFWMKQVCMNKGGSGIGRGVQDEAWESRFEFDGTKLLRMPVFAGAELAGLARRMDAYASEYSQMGAARVLARWPQTDSVLEVALEQEYTELNARLREMVALQEQIDWAVYSEMGLYGGPLRSDSAALAPGTRPFEVTLAAANPSTQWFARNGYEDPRSSEEADRSTDERVSAAKASLELALIETPEFKRRWAVRDRTHETKDAARAWALDVIERAFSDASIRSARELVGELLATPGAPDVARLIDGEGGVAMLNETLSSASIPFLAAFRHSEEGLAKHAIWCSVWESQRAQDRGETVDVIQVPPRYEREDFLGNAWSLRGKLDVPKERLIAYPECESDHDAQPIYGSAGWTHLQRAQVLASLYMKRKESEGWTKERLTPMLAGLLELVPWVKQWHNEPSEEFGGLRMGDYFQQFLDAECKLHGLSYDDLRAWRPEKRSGRKAKAVRESDDDEAAPAKQRAPRKPRKKKDADVEESQ